MTKVQCRCGAVEIEITAKPIVQFFCHCDDCQAVHGAPTPRNPSIRQMPSGSCAAIRWPGNSSAIPASPAANAAPASSSMSSGGISGASMGSCSRRANSSPRFTCSASSQSGRWSMNSRIIRACRSALGAQTIGLGGRLAPSTPATCHPRESGHPDWRTSPVEFRIRGNDKTAGCDLSESKALRTYTRSARRFGSSPD